MNEDKASELKKTHPLGLNGIYKICKPNVFLKDFYFYISFYIGVLLIVINFILENSIIKFITISSSLILSITSSIFGIFIVSFIVFISIGNIQHAERISEPNPEFSVLQKTISIFVFSIIIQISVMLFIFILKSILVILPSIQDDTYSIKVIFSILSLALTTFGLYSIFLINITIMSLFNFSQVVHFITRKDLMENEQK